MKQIGTVIESADVVRESAPEPPPPETNDDPATAPAAPTVGPVNPLDLPAEQFRAGLDRRGHNRRALLEWIREALVEAVDYGRIPTKRGPSKPSLWKPGAEKICGMLGVTVHLPTLHEYEQAALQGVQLQHVILRCELHDSAGRVVAAGVGARSLKQDGGDLNKTLKMAAKSAHIDATLRMAGLSEVFTQDLEDIQAGNAPGSGSPSRAQPNEKPAPSQPQTITQAQHKALEARIRELSLDRDRVKSWVQRAWGVEHLHELPAHRLKELRQRMDRWAQQHSGSGEESAS